MSEYKPYKLRRMRLPATARLCARFGDKRETKETPMPDDLPTLLESLGDAVPESVRAVLRYPYIHPEYLIHPAIRDLLLALRDMDCWDGHMRWLAKHYPPEIFDGSSGDPGPTIIVLTREVDRLLALVAKQKRMLEAAPFSALDRPVVLRRLRRLLGSDYWDAD